MADTATIAALLAAGADVNAQEGGGGPDGRDRDRKTVLMKVVYSDYADAARVRLLLQNGADVSARSSKGGTALAEARRKGATDIVALLVDAGAKE
jgi:ankyrin repeat protein